VRAAAGLLFIVLAVGGCSKPAADGAVDGGRDAALIEAAVVETAPEPPPPPPPLSPPASGEARRSTLRTLDREPLLRPYLRTLEEHFRLARSDAPGPFAMQRTELAGARTAVLLSRADESDPIVLVVDRDQLVWSKPRPTAGITPPVLHPTISPRPDGGLALFAYVASLHIVAARMWADDGNAYAEIDVFHPDACDALTSSYEPGQGWTLACTSKTGKQSARLREDLTTSP
jgi:hypothetical protein